MSPSRKKPYCHQCGSPMEGHKRPNGSPICPSKSPSPCGWRPHSPSSPPRRLRASKSPPSSSVPWIPGNGNYYHRRNPNWVEPSPPTPAQPLQRHDTEISLVATEIVDDHVYVNLKGNGRAKTSTTNKDVIVVDENTTYAGTSHQNDNSSTATTSQQPSTVSRISRTFSEVMTNSRALASIFSTPPKNAAAVSLAARRRGLYAGLMADSTGNIRVKEENPFDPDLGSPARDRNIVVIGQDASAVQHLLEAGEDHLRSLALDAGSRPRVGAYPVNPNSIRPTFFDIIIAGAVGGFIVLWILSSL